MSELAPRLRLRLDKLIALRVLHRGAVLDRPLVLLKVQGDLCGVQLQEMSGFVGNICAHPLTLAIFEPNLDQTLFGAQ